MSLLALLLLLKLINENEYLIKIFRVKFKNMNFIPPLFWILCFMLSLIDKFSYKSLTIY